MFRTLYITLLFILHRVADIFEFICDILVYIKLQINILSSSVKCNSDLAEETKRLKKLPVHLTILLGKEDPSIKDLTNFIFWAISSGIPYISFYDNRGILKKTFSNFKEEVEKLKGNAHILWHNEDGGSCRNGFTGRKIHVKLLSPSDGRGKIVETCKNLSLCEKMENVDIKLIDEVLRKSFEFPDPDLAVHCGKTFSLYDYPPWQISVTEFVNIRSHNKISRYQFLDILKRYSKCEQRLGT